MDDMQMFALYGRKQLELDNLNDQYDRLLTVLSGVVSGEISSDLVTFDLQARKWAVVVHARTEVGEPTDPAQTVQTVN